MTEPRPIGMKRPDSWRKSKTVRATKATNAGWVYFDPKGIEIYVDLPGGPAAIRVPRRMVERYVSEAKKVVR